jgi:hypothetical protein
LIEKNRIIDSLLIMNVDMPPDKYINAPFPALYQD